MQLICMVHGLLSHPSRTLLKQLQHEKEFFSWNVVGASEVYAVFQLLESLIKAYIDHKSFCFAVAMERIVFLAHLHGAWPLISSLRTLLTQLHSTACIAQQPFHLAEQCLAEDLSAMKVCMGVVMMVMPHMLAQVLAVSPGQPVLDVMIGMCVESTSNEPGQTG